jgi:hypothetical protein
MGPNGRLGHRDADSFTLFNLNQNDHLGSVSKGGTQKLAKQFKIVETY